MLDEMSMMIFLLEDKHDIMPNLRQTLVKISTDLLDSVPRESGIPLRKREVNVAKISKSKDFRPMTLQRRNRTLNLQDG